MINTLIGSIFGVDARRALWITIETAVEIAVGMTIYFLKG